MREADPTMQNEWTSQLAHGEVTEVNESGKEFVCLGNIFSNKKCFLENHISHMHQKENNIHTKTASKENRRINKDSKIKIKLSSYLYQGGNPNY